MSSHPCNVVNAMRLLGLSLADMLPAYPGKDEAYLDQLLRDNSLSLSRPVMAYGLLGIHPCSSSYFNVTPQGFRSNGGVQPWPPDPGRTSVFFFGGSTTLGWYMEDRQTIPACLQRALTAGGLACEVYNFGGGIYSSRHEALRFLDLLDRGIVPDHAVFMDGFNETYYALGNTELVDALDSLYQAEKRRRRMSYPAMLADCVASGIAARSRSLPDHLTYEGRQGKETFQDLLSDAAITAALETSHQPRPREELTPSQARLSKMVWDRYLDSAAVIQALAARRGVTPHFVWQPVPLFKARPEHRVMEGLYRVYRHIAFGWSVYNWLHAEGFPGMGSDARFLNLAALAEDSRGVVYCDAGHYTAAFSQKIAEAIALKAAFS